MNLHGSLARLLKAGSTFYRGRADCFAHNPVIQDAWLRLAQDMMHQAKSLDNLSDQFWKEFHQSQPAMLGTIQECATIREPGHPCDSVPLQDSISRALTFEEPIILRIYAPIVRHLRLAWIYQALDFYVMVKAHVAHLIRLVRTYSADPVLIQRAASLLELFEHEVQEPEKVAAAKPRLSKGSAKRQAASRAAKKPTKTAAKQTSRLPIVSRRGGAAKGSQPLLRKIRISRSRAGR